MLGVGRPRKLTGEGARPIVLEDRLSAEAISRYRKLPVSLRILTENTLRNRGNDDTHTILNRHRKPINVHPTRILMQDLLAVPLLADLASLRSELSDAGLDPDRVSPAVPMDLVIDHSMTLFHHRSAGARALNERREFQINAERFSFIKWCEQSFESLTVVPPGKGIVHQINLEQLATCACVDQDGDAQSGILYPEMIIGTDSHTPMINGLGVLGWGVGGLEAEAVMLGRPLELIVPKVVGVRLSGRLEPGALASDLALHMTEQLRGIDVVDCFVEFFGPGLASLTVSDRATVANMAPEYGATCAYFPTDEAVLDYLRRTGRSSAHVASINLMATQLELRADDACEYDVVHELDLGTIGPSVAGPSRPQDRRVLSDVPQAFAEFAPEERSADLPGESHPLCDGDVVIAAITSCTNTANPRAMLTAGLLARNANKVGLETQGRIKTSLAPGSQAVAGYLRSTGLQDDLDALGFQVVGFACTTCNGMSGPLDPVVAHAIETRDLSCAAVLSGNRNFPGRIHPNVRANFITSPPLVVAYAIAGSVRTDLSREPLGTDRQGKPVHLSQIWPAADEVDRLMDHVDAEFKGHAPGRQMSRDKAWDELPVQAGSAFAWDPESGYIKRSPYFGTASARRNEGTPLEGLRPIAVLGDDITTDHISPSGGIPANSAAGQFLSDQGVSEDDLNAYGTRRANPDIVVRSFFANPALDNLLTGGKGGSLTRLIPDGAIVPLFDAVQTYRARGEGLIIIGGHRYGGGSSRDTAAKAPYLAGVRAVIAKSFERIHRSNLINMGIWPLVPAGQAPDWMRVTAISISNLPIEFGPELRARACCRQDDVTDRILALHVDIRTANELEIVRSGGLLAGTLEAYRAADA